MSQTGGDVVAVTGREKMLARSAPSLQLFEGERNTRLERLQARFAASARHGTTSHVD